MGTRIRRGTLQINGGTAVALVAKFSWKDNPQFDRSRADNQSYGKPVLMSKGGSGSFELLAGAVPATGYGTGNMVFTFKEITVSAGSESSTNRTATFTKVTFNRGGRIPIEGSGRIPINFEYAVCTLA